MDPWTHKQTEGPSVITAYLFCSYYVPKVFLEQGSAWPGSDSQGQDQDNIQTKTRVLNVKAQKETKMI